MTIIKLCLTLRQFYMTVLKFSKLPLKLSWMYSMVSVSTNHAARTLWVLASLKKVPQFLLNSIPYYSHPLYASDRFHLHGRMAILQPYIKKEDRLLPSNYRPISLLCQAGKSMERCVHKVLYNYINEHKLLTPYQLGFVPGDSTTFQLLHTYHMFCEAVDGGKEVRVVFCDISKASDRVWHRGLIHKLRDIGCSDRLLNWFSSYLSNRRQRVIYNGQASEWTFVKAGVPQGSILGPLLFLIYINDIVNELSASVRLFADDTSLYMFCAKLESVQFRNCPAQSGNSHFVGRSGNSYFAQSNSGIARAQSGNRDKVRISIRRIRN